MKTIANTVPQVIGKTPEQYQLEIFNLYWKYCQAKSRNDAELQVLLINTTFNSWFLREVRALEHRFLEDVKPFVNSSFTPELFKIWQSTMLHIFSIYSFPSIKGSPKALNNWKPQYN